MLPVAVKVWTTVLIQLKPLTGRHRHGKKKPLCPYQDSFDPDKTEICYIVLKTRLAYSGYAVTLSADESAVLYFGGVVQTRNPPTIPDVHQYKGILRTLPEFSAFR